MLVWEENKVDKPLPKLTKNREKTQITSIILKEIAIKFRDLVREYFNKNLYFNKLENLEETHKFLDAYDFQKLNWKEIDDLYRPITSSKTEAVIKSLQTKKCSEIDALTNEAWMHLKIH